MRPRERPLQSPKTSYVSRGFPDAADHLSTWPFQTRPVASSLASAPLSPKSGFNASSSAS